MFPFQCDIFQCPTKQKIFPHLSSHLYICIIIPCLSAIHSFLCYIQGYYANQTGLSACVVCPKGFECTGGTIDPAPCPQGYYCAIGSNERFKGVKQPCPEGTLGARTGLSEETQCEDCPGGKYCQLTALKNYTGICDPGYYCRRRATRSAPTEDAAHDPKWFGPCPTGGYYCPAGSVEPQPCMPGRYAPNGQQQIKSAEECTKCKAGSYCANGKQTTVTGPCADGYFCLEGSPTSHPNSSYGGLCPAGYKCPSGSAWPEPCVQGTYQNSTGQKVCLSCPAGFFCAGNTTVPDICPPGYFCPLNSYAGTTNACPVGTFNNLTGQWEEKDCVTCTSGFYCNKKGK